MGYVMFWVGFITLAIMGWRFVKEAKEEAWEEGFKAGSRSRIIRIELGNEEED